MNGMYGKLLEIVGELGAATSQMFDDDQIICNHIYRAEALTRSLLREVEAIEAKQIVDNIEREIRTVRFAGGQPS